MPYKSALATYPTRARRSIHGATSRVSSGMIAQARCRCRGVRWMKRFGWRSVFSVQEVVPTKMLVMIERALIIPQPNCKVILNNRWLWCRASGLAVDPREDYSRSIPRRARYHGLVNEGTLNGDRNSSAPTASSTWASCVSLNPRGVDEGSRGPAGPLPAAERAVDLVAGRPIAACRSTYPHRQWLRKTRKPGPCGPAGGGGPACARAAATPHRHPGPCVAPSSTGMIYSRGPFPS